MSGVNALGRGRSVLGAPDHFEQLAIGVGQQELKSEVKVFSIRAVRAFTGSWREDQQIPTGLQTQNWSLISGAASFPGEVTFGSNTLTLSRYQ